MTRVPGVFCIFAEKRKIMKFPFKSNIVINKTPVDFIPEVGDQFFVCEAKEAAVMAVIDTYDESDTTEVYYTEDDETKNYVFCNPLVFGDRKFGFIGIKKKTTPAAASESITSRVFYLYEMI